jgi:spermidine synthase
MTPIACDVTTHERPAASAFLGAVFFVSGAVALLYEAAWQRQFTLLFGSAAPATAAVLAAYFAGLGLGSYVLGRVGTRWRQPLRAYGVLELITAGGALLVAPILSLYAIFYPALFEGFEGSGAAFLAVKGLLAFAAIVIPTMAMGGTLPVLAQLFESRRARLGELAGWLYMLNTAGAAIGVLGFPLLLGAMGMRNTVWLCAGLNVVIAAAAFLLAKNHALDTEETAPAPKAAASARPAAIVSVRTWMALAFVSGFVTFALQVSWSRAFGLVHENSVYSFSLIVALFIGAIAAGAQWARVILRRSWSPRRALGGMWIAGGTLTLLGPLIFSWLTGGLKFAPGDSVIEWKLLGTAFMVIFVPMMLLAAGLPLILQGAANASKLPAANVTGTVLAWNIAGSVAGALAAGFVLPPVFGLWNAMFFSALVVLVIAGLLFGKSSLVQTILSGGSLLAAGLGWLFNLPRTSVDKANGEKLIAVEEGAHGVIAVVAQKNSLRLKLNNHYTLGGTLAVGDERMQAHIPLLLHPDPRPIAFLGYGTGITAGGALLHNPGPMPGSKRMSRDQNFHVTALELVPEVARLAREAFAGQNQNFATHPSAELVIEDARNYLRGTPRKFDLIVGDLVVPWRHGEGALYTLEHFAAARERLAPGGLYCAWLPLFQLGEEDFHCIARTFLEVFPRAYVFRGDFSPAEPALALAGFVSGDWNPVSVEKRIAQMQPDPMNPQLKHARAFWMHLIGFLQKGAAEAEEHPLNTEDRPVVELRWKRPPPFTGHRLKSWEDQLRADSASALRTALPADALAGWECGKLMTEFTLLLVEGKMSRANGLLNQLREKLGPEAARAVFGD